MLKQIFSSDKLRVFLAITLATIAFTLWSYIWYATVFDDIWQGLIERTFFTCVISAVQVFGLYLLFRFTRAKTFWDYQIIAAIISVMIALPVLGNAVLFEGASEALWGLDFTHFVLGYAGIASSSRLTSCQRFCFTKP